MCQGGKPDTGKSYNNIIGKNVCGSTYESGWPLMRGPWHVCYGSGLI